MVASAERLIGIAERPFWVGKDGALRRGIIVPPHGGWQETEVVFPYRLPDDLSEVYVSIRSRYSQLGLNARILAHEANEGVANLRVDNYAPITAILPEGTPFCRPYTEGDRNIEGEVLDERFGNDISIIGENGSWGKLTDETGKPIGVRLSIDPTSRRRIVSIGRPIVLNFNRNYRDEIDRYAQPIEADLELSFWFGETYAHVQLNNGVIGIIQDMKGAYHLQSRLIDSGTNWPIRVEVVSSTLPTEIPQHVDVVFQEAR